MPGEDPASTQVGDVLHWINVYQELVGFKAKMLADVTDSIAGMTADAASEVGKIDVTLLERQAQQYGARLGFWQQRERELAGANPQSTQGGA